MEDYLKTQIGGLHYKSFKMQPVELYARVPFNYFQSSIIRYALRFKNKNGKQDLEKCLHISDLGKQLDPFNTCTDIAHSGMIIPPELAHFVRVNNLDEETLKFLNFVAVQDWDSIKVYIGKLIQENYAY